MIVHRRRRRNRHSPAGIHRHAGAKRCGNGGIDDDKAEIGRRGTDARSHRIGIHRRRHIGLRTHRQGADRGVGGADRRVGIHRGRRAARQRDPRESRPHADRADTCLAGDGGNGLIRIRRQSHTLRGTDAAECGLRDARIIDHDHCGTQTDIAGRQIETQEALVGIQRGVHHHRPARRIVPVIGRGDVIGDREDIDRRTSAHHATGHLAEHLEYSVGVVGQHRNRAAGFDMGTGMDQRGRPRRGGRLVFQRRDLRSRGGCGVHRTARRTAGAANTARIAVGSAATAGQAANPLAAGDEPGAGLRLTGGGTVGAAVAVLSGVGAVAAVVGIAAGQLGADRPHTDRGSHAHRPTRATDHIAGQVLQPDSIDRDIIGRRNLSAAIDLRIGVVGQRANIHRTRHTDKATGHTDDIAVDRRVVGCIDIHTLPRTGGLRRGHVDRRPAADGGLGGGLQQGHAHRPGHPHIARRTSGDDVQDVFSRLRLNDHARRIGGLERTAGDGAVQNAGLAAPQAQRIDMRITADGGIGGLIEQDHTRGTANADLSPRQGARQFEDVGGVARQHRNIVARLHGGIVTDARRRLIRHTEHIDHSADADRTGGGTNADHRDILAAGGGDDDIVLRANCRALANGGGGRVGDQIHPNGRCHAHGANAHAHSHREMIEIIARPNQHRLPRIGRGRGCIHLGVGADICLGCGIDQIDAGGHANAHAACPEGDGERANLILVRRRHRHTVKAALRAQCGGAYALQRWVVDLLAGPIAGQIHAGHLRRANLPCGVKRGPIARGCVGQRAAAARIDADTRRAAWIERRGRRIQPGADAAGIDRIARAIAIGGDVGANPDKGLSLLG